MYNNFFFQNSAVYYLFFLFFYYFWHFIFNFVYLYLWKNSRYFYVFSFYGLEILSKNFGKSWNTFLKDIDIWNLKFFINSIIYYLLFYFSSILEIFFSCFTNQNLSKNSKQFCGDLLYGFYKRILENSWIFIEKNRDILNTKHFQNSIVYYLLF